MDPYQEGGSNPTTGTKELLDKDNLEDLGNGYLSNFLLVSVGAPTMLTNKCALRTVYSITINLLQLNERMCIDFKGQIPANIVGA